MAASHPVLQQACLNAGFKEKRESRIISIGPSLEHAGLSADASDWLVNFDWGDNGLRAPFLDEQTSFLRAA